MQVESATHSTQRIVSVLQMGVAVREAHWAVSVHSANVTQVTCKVQSSTGRSFKACMWLREFCWQVEAEVVRNSYNKIHQTVIDLLIHLRTRLRYAIDEVQADVDVSPLGVQKNSW